MVKAMLITGASGGIGKEPAKVFAADGWSVVATMRSPEKEHDLVPSDNLMLTRLALQNAFVNASTIKRDWTTNPSITPKK
jgi:NAD(P)-dependent dehydrogenase (short-subunit alcohol dehydrogenase family)